MTELHATPYDTSATGFYFSDFESYTTQAATHTNDYGQPVEEYEIQFIDGEKYQLFAACSINQCNLQLWFDEIEDLTIIEQAEMYYRLSNLFETLESIIDDLGQKGSISQQSLSDYTYELVDQLEIDEPLKSYFNYDQYQHDLELNGYITAFTYRGESYIAEGL